jgi:hypothetical protein
MKRMSGWNWEHQEGKKQKIVILPAISEQIIGFPGFMILLQ